MTILLVNENLSDGTIFLSVYMAVYIWLSDPCFFNGRNTDSDPPQNVQSP